MTKKIRVGILFGGKSAEHEVSLQSAKNVAEAIDKNKFDITLIAIDKTGRWLLPDQSQYLLHADDPSHIALNTKDQQMVSLIPQSNGALSPAESAEDTKIDVVFPILHGTFGEDGTVQGLLKLSNIPFVGASVLGSAIGMDKDVMKRLLRDAGITIAAFKTFTAPEAADFTALVSELGIPFFVKPANLGSSVGVSKVHDESEFKAAIESAFQYDTKILVEEFIEGREVECAVLGNDHPQASGVGEIIPHHEFYSYDAKYIDKDGAGLEVPANISPEITKKIQELAIRTFQILCCEGLARVDCFLRPDGTLVVNEINTMPGFTKISMYPRLWSEAGISYPELIDRLIQLAIERFAKEQHLKTSF